MLTNLKMFPKVLITICLSLSLFNTQLSSAIDGHCLDCICQASSGCNLDLKCVQDYHGNLYCGPFLLSYEFWTIGGQLSSNFKKCAFDKNCAEATIRNYMALNGKDCDSDGSITCLDYALMYPIGPYCDVVLAKSTHFWHTFYQTSCANQSLTLDTANVYKRNETINIPNEDKRSDRNLENKTSNFNLLDVETAQSTLIRDISTANSEDNEIHLEADLYSNFVIPAPLQNDLFWQGSIKPTFTTPNKCFDCLCQASTYCNLDSGCQNGYCGPYALSYAYFEEVDEPYDNFLSCTQDKSCSEEILRRYILKYYQDCNGDGYIDCDDFALIYRFGQNCKTNESYSLDFFNHVEYCTILSDKARRDPEFHSIVRLSNRTADYEGNSFNRSLLPLFVVRPEDKRKTVITQDILKIDRMCMECICEASSGCNVHEGVCPVNSSCGPYQINKQYWNFCGRPDYRGAANDFDRCANSLRCSQKCVRQFINTYVTDCNQDGVIDCLDYAILHQHGPHCQNFVNVDNFYKSDYWLSFDQCRKYGQN